MSRTGNEPGHLVAEVAFLPSMLRDEQIHGRTVIVFDVLRATTSITAALAASVSRVRIFGDLAQAADAAAVTKPRPILCGEINALRPPGFDLGNSPGQFRHADHAGKTVYISTTNGTKAIVAARSASAIYAAALVNASLAATKAAATNRDLTLLCSGTAGEISMEDLIGAGAVLDALLKTGRYVIRWDGARIAHRLFLDSRDDLLSALRDCQGGRNVIAAGLTEDIDFAARLDVIDVVGTITDTSSLTIEVAG